jgi:hypothetical protein
MGVLLPTGLYIVKRRDRRTIKADEGIGGGHRLRV